MAKIVQTITINENKKLFEILIATSKNQTPKDASVGVEVSKMVTMPQMTREIPINIGLEETDKMITITARKRT